MSTQLLESIEHPSTRQLRADERGSSGGEVERPGSLLPVRREARARRIGLPLALVLYAVLVAAAADVGARWGSWSGLLVVLVGITAGIAMDTLRLLLRIWPGTRAVALVFFEELPRLRSRHGEGAVQDLVSQLAELLVTKSRAQRCEVDAWQRFQLSFVRLRPKEVERELAGLSASLATQEFGVAAERLRLTPAIGFATGGRHAPMELLGRRALTVLERARQRRDLCPVRFRRRYGSSGRWPRSAASRLRLPAQILGTHLLALGLPFLVYASLLSVGIDALYPMYLLVLGAIVLTAGVVWIESLSALRRVDPPSAPCRYPPATAIIAAFLPNEAATVVESVKAMLAMNYPAPLKVVLAYNTPADHPVELELRKLARVDRRFKPLRVHGSTSKAENVNAALAAVSGAFVGLFDADHHPDPDAFVRAWRWLGNGYDVVQGHCVIRNAGASWLTRLIGVEFEQMYAIAHPGRSRLHGFGIFGGSNGYWRSEVLWETRLRPSMLTEDIDSTLRMVLAGRKIVSDPLLLSRELAPVTVGSLWNQRMRWAQGWHQVARRYFWRSVFARGVPLTFRQRLGLAYLLGWRDLYPWVSIQMAPILLCLGWEKGWPSLLRFVPLFALATLFSAGTALAQTALVYRLAEPSIRRHRAWFAWWMAASVVYGEFRNAISRVAQVKEFVGDREWKVTGRAGHQPVAPERDGQPAAPVRGRSLEGFGR